MKSHFKAICEAVLVVVFGFTIFALGYVVIELLK